MSSQAWGRLGMLAIHQIVIVDPLLKRARRTNALIEFLGFTPTDTQKSIVRKSDPLIIQHDISTLAAHPTESLIVEHERIAFGAEILEKNIDDAWKQAVELASETKELALLFPSVVQGILFGTSSEEKS